MNSKIRSEIRPGVTNVSILMLSFVTLTSYKVTKTLENVRINVVVWRSTPRKMEPAVPSSSSSLLFFRPLS